MEQVAERDRRRHELRYTFTLRREPLFLPPRRQTPLEHSEKVENGRATGLRPFDEEIRQDGYRRAVERHGDDEVPEKALGAVELGHFFSSAAAPRPLIN